MTIEAINVPDLGGADEVEIIEITVAVGDSVEVDQPLMTLESDKASMDMPSPFAGVIKAIRVKVGDSVGTGVHAFDIESVVTGAASPAPAAATVAAEPAPAAEPKPAPARASEPVAPEPVSAAAQPALRSIDIVVPDLGGADSVEVVELTVSVGDRVSEGDGIAVLEGDKASMDLPAPFDGVIESLTVTAGQQVGSGSVVGTMTVSLQQSATIAPAAAPAVNAVVDAPAPSAPEAPVESISQTAVEPPADGNADDGITGLTRALKRSQDIAGAAVAKPNPQAEIYAGPAVRGLARDFGVTLAAVKGSGPRGRVLKEDVQSYVKTRLSEPQQASVGSAVPPVPEVDFSQFGDIEELALNNIQKATVTSMSRSWLNVPHVTQFDYADVTELEAFRTTLKPEMEKRGNKLTPLPFLLLAVARALRENPRFNSSIHPDGKRLFLKKYCHIGMAVDTPNGLMVPVIRDVDQKTVWELAEEARELAAKARDRKLKPAEMQGGCFTISSLGNIGGEGFTPIVNAPEVAILGVSKLAVRPVWDGQAFQPRQTLPLSLSYDHKVINGADAGRFMTYLCDVLADIRRLLL